MNSLPCSDMRNLFKAVAAVALIVVVLAGAVIYGGIQTMLNDYEWPDAA